MPVDIETSLLVLGDRPATELVAQAQHAESLGYARLWHADERFFRDPWASLSRVAANTSTLELGVCVTDPFVRHPALTARAYATVDEIADGRATLGLGIGVSGFAELGITRQRPLVAMRESVELIRALVAGEAVDVDGEVVSFRDGRLDFDARPRSRIFIATNGPQMLRLAGELADGVIVQGLASKEMVDSNRALIAEGAERGGRSVDDVRLVARVDTCIHDDATVAKACMRPGLIRHLRTHHPHYNSFKLAQLDVPADIREAVSNLRYGHGGSAAAELESRIPDDYVERFCLAGTTTDVIDHVRRLHEIGVDELMVMPLAAGDVSRAYVIERFAREVVGTASTDMAGHP
jgi:5,10-methylenetetrahydromethanopterin reductase